MADLVMPTDFDKVLVGTDLLKTIVDDPAAEGVGIVFTRGTSDVFAVWDVEPTQEILDQLAGKARYSFDHQRRTDA